MAAPCRFYLHMSHQPAANICRLLVWPWQRFRCTFLNVQLQEFWSLPASKELLQLLPGIAFRCMAVTTGAGYGSKTQALADGGLATGGIVHAVVQQQVLQVLRSIGSKGCHVAHAHQR